MNTKLLTIKTIDFILLLSVISLGLGIFKQNWIGIFIGLFALFIALVIISRTKE